MSLLPATYFAFFIALAAWSFIDDFKSKVGPVRLFGEALTDAALLLVALTYWLPGVRSAIGLAATFIFGLAVAAFLVALVATIRRRFPDSELPRSGNVFVFVAGTALIILVVAPLLYWGFSAVVLHHYAGT